MTTFRMVIGTRHGCCARWNRRMLVTFATIATELGEAASTGEIPGLAGDGTVTGGAEADGILANGEVANEILYLADNAGEIVIDRLLIERLPPVAVKWNLTESLLRTPGDKVEVKLHGAATGDVKK